MNNEIIFISHLMNYEPLPANSSRRLLCSVGPSRSGKSTWSNKWVRFKKEMYGVEDRPRTILCADTIRLTLSNKRYLGALEPTVFYHQYVMLKTLLLQGNEVFFDETNTTKTSIRRILEIDASASFLIFDTPLDICIERAYKTNQNDMAPVITRHKKQLDMLLEEGFENVLHQIHAEISYRKGEEDKVV